MSSPMRQARRHSPALEEGVSPRNWINNSQNMPVTSMANSRVCDERKWFVLVDLNTDTN